MSVYSSMHLATQKAKLYIINSIVSLASEHQRPFWFLRLLSVSFGKCISMERQMEEEYENLSPTYITKQRF